MAEETKDTREVVSEGKEKGQKKKTKKKRRVLLKVLIVMLFLMVIGWFTVGIEVMKLHAQAQKIVSNASEDTFRASQTSIVYDTNGDVMTKLKGEKDVYYLKYKDIPVYAVGAVVSVEDRNFYKHNGVDFKGIARAAYSILMNKGEVTQGGSTITQQLARTVFLTREVSWKRKVKEIFVAMDLEKIYSKDQILEFYLNNVYFANGYYGIQAASRGYFRKDAEDLTISQAAFLCAIPNAPTMYDPYKHKSETMTRRNKILKDMREQGLINQDNYEDAINEKIKIEKKKSEEKHNYVETYVIYCATRAIMKEQGFSFKTTFSSNTAKKEYAEQYNETYNKCKRSLYTSGYRIYTSIDLEVQNDLQKSIDQTLAMYKSKDKNKIYKTQGAGTCIDNETGQVTAIVGGRSQKNIGYTLNRAYQSPRQPGSSIKPLLVYAPALEKGYAPGSVLNDNPMDSSDKHHVSNYGGSYSGSISLREAVAKSSNVATMRLYEELGPETALRYLEKMNFNYLTKSDYKYYTTCLGGFTYGTTTEEMAAGYAALENDGVYREPTCVKKIKSADGETIISKTTKKKSVYSEAASQSMTDVLQSVMSDGTGRGAQVPNVDTAGKTGTTTDNKDGWFCGYTPYYTTAIWIGRDDNKELEGLTGATYPKTAWSNFMDTVHKEYTESAQDSTEDSGDSYNSDYNNDGNDNTYSTRSRYRSTTEDSDYSTTSRSTEATDDTEREQEVDVTERETERATEESTKAPATTEKTTASPAPSPAPADEDAE